MSEPLLSLWDEGPPEPYQARFNAARYCVGAPARRLRDKQALVVVDGDAPGEAREVWTFGALDEAVRRAAGALLEAGLRPGDRVMIRIGDGPQFPIAYFGAMAAGAIAMPLSSQLSADELSTIAADATPSIALLSDDTPDFALGNARRLDPLALGQGAAVDYADSAATDPAQLVYTSGSSGKPKGVLHAHRAIWARRMMRYGWHDLRETDRVMHVGAFNWTYTLGVGLADTWSVGATAILNAGQRAPEIWPVLAEIWKPSVFAAVPGVYRRILKYGANTENAFASLRHALTAGEKLSGQILEEWQGRTGKLLLESLGMSEVSTYISSSPARQAGQGFAGWPQPGRRVAILSDTSRDAVPRGTEGVLAVHRSDPGLMLGYWQQDEATQCAYRDDWFITGDRALMREDGAIAYCGRDDDLMNAQGYRVSPLEVEQVLASHPDVAECAVAEQSISEGLSVIAAWVVPTESAKLLTRTSLSEHCAARLASYKCPRNYFSLATLPRSSNGKLQRRMLSSNIGHGIE